MLYHKYMDAFSHTSATTLSRKPVPDGIVNASTRSKDSTDCGYVELRKEGCGDDIARTKMRGSWGT
jgi:hypothetical protein